MEKIVKTLILVATVVISSICLVATAIAQPQEIDMGEFLEGDLDNSGSILPADFNIFKSNYPCFSGCVPEDGDLDRDGKIIPADFNVFKANYPRFTINEV